MTRFRSSWPCRSGRRPARRGAAAGLLLALAAVPGLADTLRPFVPGGSPCGDACDLAWAAAAFGVAPGAPTPMVLPAGSILGLMSYARGGVPFVDRSGFVTVEEHDGIGYRLADGQVMFQVRACGNWTVATLPYASAALAAPSLLDTAAGAFSSSATGVAPGWSWPAGGGFPGGGVADPGRGPDPERPGRPPRDPANWPGTGPDRPILVVDPVRDPPKVYPPIPVPLPWAGLLLVIGLGLLWRRRS